MLHCGQKLCIAKYKNIELNSILGFHLCNATQSMIMIYARLASSNLVAKIIFKQLPILLSHTINEGIYFTNDQPISLTPIPYYYYPELGFI